MSSYKMVNDFVDAKLKKYENDGVEIGNQYARLTGELEMKVVFLLDYIKIHHGEKSFNDAVERFMNPF